MKRLLLILILTLSFQTLVKADNIRDLEIEGMSIGDSLLDFYSKDKIIDNFNNNSYPNSDKYWGISIIEKVNKYDGIKFHVKTDDKKYLIAAISGRIHFEKNANCLKEKDKILLEITSSITIINRKDYIFDYPQYIKSKSHITDLIINGGKIRVFCDDLSDEVVKELNLVKSLAITLNSKIFDTWLNTEAYK